jgi:hypothetical protein
MSAKDDVQAISHLVGDALSQFARLFQNEVELAKAEITEKVTQVARGGALVAAGAILIMPAIFMALLSLSAALTARGWSPAIAHLASAIFAFVLAGVLFAVGVNWLKAGGLLPQETLRQLEKDKRAIEGMMR